MVVRFFTLIVLVCCEAGFAQVQCNNKIDSLNTKLQNGTPVDLSYYGKARIELKERVIYLNCTITEVNSLWVIYKKGGALHDQMIDKIKVIRFEEQSLKLEFNDLNKGKLKYNYE
jgi:hypothetical protein